MPIEVDLKNFKYVILKCSKCGNSIKATVAARGTSKVSDAIARLDQQAKSRNWKRNPDVCPSH